MRLSGGLVACFAVLAAFAQTTPAGLPKQAVVLETQRVKPGRALVLWIMNPEMMNPETTNPQTIEQEPPSACPGLAGRSRLRGPTRISLIDDSSGAILNTIPVTPREDEDRFEVPFGHPANPQINLKDINGDGNAHEFVLYASIPCLAPPAALFGYSERQDKVIQYPLDLTVLDGLRREDRVEMWPARLFDKAPQTPGTWRFTVDGRERGGCIDSYDIAYSPSAERFSGTLTASNCAREN